MYKKVHVNRNDDAKQMLLASSSYIYKNTKCIPTVFMEMVLLEKL